jgi:NAD(P)-dependent dehydrogenase (short-subunit alcohol dehydrogenase family)
MDHAAVVITGAGGGLGGATAVLLAERGYPLILTGRTPETLVATAERVQAAGGEAMVVSGDASDEQHAQDVFDAAEEHFGGCEALLNAAATHGTPMRFSEMPVEEWDAVMRTNLRSTFLFTRGALRLMLPRGRGSIVLVASAGVLRGFPLAAPYAATKSALLGYARTLAAEVGPEGVRVNVLTPGANPDTAIFHSAMPAIAREMGFSEDQMVPLLEGMSALRRPCTAAELAKAAAFLLTDDASAMTGQNLVVDAGLTA